MSVAIAGIGHNQPPSPIDEALSPYGDTISESEGWLDGSTVENEGQMKAVDALIKDMKAARKAVEAAEESSAKPLFDLWKAEKAKFKPTLDDLDRIVKGLVAAVSSFKTKLSAEKAAAEKLAREEAWRKVRAAEDAARAASVSDIEAQRAAAQAQSEAEVAVRAAQAAAKDKPLGLRTVTRYEVTDHRALLRWIALNDREAITAFIESWAQHNHKGLPQADGLRVWKEKQAW